MKSVVAARGKSALREVLNLHIWAADFSLIARVAKLSGKTQTDFILSADRVGHLKRALGYSDAVDSRTMLQRDKPRHGPTASSNSDFALAPLLDGFDQT